MKPFKHQSAKTIDEAAALLKEYAGKAKLIAGGTDLLGELKDRVLVAYPEALVNIKAIPGMDYIREEAGVLRIGALAKLGEIATSPVVKGKYNALAQAARSVASPQIRNAATIGGNLCQDIRCWYYRASPWCGAPFMCFLKGGQGCYALTGENQYHSIFGAAGVTSPPCSLNCPGTVDIASYLSQTRGGNLVEAAKVLLNTNPFPAITGRVCPHFCEQNCNRDKFDESVSIRAAERFIGDYVLDNANEIIKPPETDTGKRVAIVGSGPAGLSAAYYLRMSGHRVTVFERMEKPGGMLTYGIPAYRLPKDIVRRVVETMENAGVEFRLKVDVGKDVTIEELKKDFDSVFLASGAWRQPSIGLKGEELTKSGLEFLTNVNRGVKEVPGKRVLVIGGGNVAVDVGITALRLGAEEVTLACLESRDKMPAFESEIEQAIEEGVKLMPSWGPYRVLESNEKVKGIELVCCTSVFDNEGCFAPSFDYAVKETVRAEQIIMAVGQTTDLSFVNSAGPLKVARGLIVVDQETQGTNMPRVFAGGEVTSGSATVIEAIAAGRRAAVAIDLYLKGATAKAEYRGEKTVEPFLNFNPEYLKKTTAVKIPRLPVSERGIDIEDAPGLGLSDIETEANRCFNCGCVGVNSSDIAVALMALGAKVKIAGPGRVRTIQIQDFFSQFKNILETAEIVTEIQVPSPEPGTKSAYLKFRLRKAIDFAIVSVACVLTFDGEVCQKARIVMGGVAPIPRRSRAAEETLKGKPLNEAAAEAAANAAVAKASALPNNRYKLQIAKVLVKRGALACK